MKIGFIGQGWIGRNYANNFEERGYEVIRYDKYIEPYTNPEKLSDCEIVFVAVPTPTEKGEINLEILRDSLKNTTEGQTVVIKSTLPPGTTESIQEACNNRFIIHSPEFLSVATAKEDADNPDRNILGYTSRSFQKCYKVMDILPQAPYSSIVPAREAEMIKYTCNAFKYMKVVFFNLVHDICEEQDISYDKIKDAVAADKMIADWHLDVNHKGGRGAGGGCLIKDFAIFRKFCDSKILKEAEKYNNELLRSTDKDLGLLNQIY